MRPFPPRLRHLPLSREQVGAALRSARGTGGNAPALFQEEEIHDTEASIDDASGGGSPLAGRRFRAERPDHRGEPGAALHRGLSRGQPRRRRGGFGAGGRRDGRCRVLDHRHQRRWHDQPGGIPQVAAGLWAENAASASVAASNEEVLEATEMRDVEFTHVDRDGRRDHHPGGVHDLDGGDPPRSHRAIGRRGDRRPPAPKRPPTRPEPRGTATRQWCCGKSFSSRWHPTRTPPR